MPEPEPLHQPSAPVALQRPRAHERHSGPAKPYLACLVCPHSSWLCVRRATESGILWPDRAESILWPTRELMVPSGPEDAETLAYLSRVWLDNP